MANGDELPPHVASLTKGKLSVDRSANPYLQLIRARPTDSHVTPSLKANRQFEEDAVEREKKQALREKLASHRALNKLHLNTSKAAIQSPKRSGKRKKNMTRKKKI